jgi:dTDP-4-dehydrorhamnose reductase
MIWLVGNRGMLGTQVAEALAGAGLESVGTDRDVDILDPAALAAFAAGKKIDWIVNCAAYTAVDRAEDEPELCRALNARGPENLARTATAAGARLLHISTDYVFDGTGTRPYREDDPVSPKGVYGSTKAEGEERVRALCPEHVIVRTAWLYGKHGPNFVYTMLRLMGAKERIGVVADQRGTPTYAADLAEAIVAILRAPQVEYGTFHFSNLGETNWHEFALAIRRLGREYGILDRNCAVDALTTAQYPTKASRPAYSVLCKDKIQAVYGLAIPDWEKSLRGFFIDIVKCRDTMSALAYAAEYDIETAEVMLNTSRYLYVAYCCEQAVEKNMKCILSLKGEPQFHHRILDLANAVGAQFDQNELHLFAELSTWYLKGRYQITRKRMADSMNGPIAASLYERSAAACEKLRKHPIFSIL